MKQRSQKYRLKLLLFIWSITMIGCSKKTSVSPGVSADTSKPSIPIYENFDSLDLKNWQVQLYSFEANGCNMRAENVIWDNSVLSLLTEKNTDPALPKKYNAGEIGDNRFYLYGYYTVKMKSDLCKGTVSAFFLMNQWQPTNWEHKEIDIEFLGIHGNAIQCTNHDFQDGGKTWKSSSKTISLPFDVGNDFHEFSILWTPDSVSWFADAKLIHTDTMYVPQEPLQIRMNYYAGDVAVPGIKEWLGEVDETCLPSKTSVDWIKRQSLEEYKKNSKAR